MLQIVACDFLQLEIPFQVTDLRNELDKRGLSTKGLKIQLIARLLKSLKDETDGGVTYTNETQPVNEVLPDRTFRPALCVFR